MNKVKFSEEKMTDLLERRRILYREIQNLQERIDNFTSRRPYTKFSYSDPHQNFNKASVKGVVCGLFKCVDNKNCLALETAAGGRVSIFILIGSIIPIKRYFSMFEEFL